MIPAMGLGPPGGEDAPGAVALGAAALLPAALLPIAFWLAGADGLWNDFTSYWLAGKLLAAGQSPYDLQALAELGAAEGRDFVLGTGYSYPLPLAVAMVPFGAMPFPLAAGLFSGISLTAFGVAVVAWLRDRTVWRADWKATTAAAVAAGLYPPVLGSVFVGQANLVIVAALSFGLRRVLRHDGLRGAVGGAIIGLAGVVKVTPLTLALPLALGRRTGAALAIVVGAAGTVLLAWVLAPAGMGGVEGLARLAGPDPYWANQSINGYVSRLALGNDRVHPVLPGVDVGLAAGFAAAVLSLVTILLVIRALRSRSAAGMLALAIGITLVAATAAAPKNSFWNHAPVLIGAALLRAPSVARDAPSAVHERALVATWYGLAVVGMGLDGVGMTGHLGGWGAVASGAPLLGLLALWMALAMRTYRRRASQA